MISPRKKRPLLTHIFIPQIHAQIDPSIYHQTLVWEKMANRFGLKENVLKEPIHFEGTKRINSKIGIVAGSSNSPEKRWLYENWIKLIQRLANFRKDLTFHLYGTDQDKAITQPISNSLKSDRVFDQAGNTNLAKLADELASCSLVIGNDTGAMYLANMLGTPVVVLFGPTHAERTKPFFDPCCTIIHSSSDDINEIDVDNVLHSITAKL